MCSTGILLFMARPCLFRSFMRWLKIATVALICSSFMSSVIGGIAISIFGLPLMSVPVISYQTSTIVAGGISFSFSFNHLFTSLYARCLLMFLSPLLMAESPICVAVLNGLFARVVRPFAVTSDFLPIPLLFCI